MDCAAEAQMAAGERARTDIGRPAASVLACFLSHVKACRQFLLDAQATPEAWRPDCAILAEDDARFHRDWAAVVAELRPYLHRHGIDVISLGYFLEWRPPRRGTPVTRGFHLHLDVPIGAPWGTVAYLVSLRHAKTIVEHYGHCIEDPRQVCSLKIPSLPADRGMFLRCRRGAVVPPIAVEQPSVLSLVGNPDQVPDGGNWQFDWIHYPSYGEPWKAFEDASPTIGLPPRGRIVSARYGLHERWMDVTDRLPADETPFRVSNLWVGADPVPFYAKQLRLELIDGSVHVASELDRVTLSAKDVNR